MTWVGGWAEEANNSRFHPQVDPKRGKSKGMITSNKGKKFKMYFQRQKVKTDIF
jgi:hypothetical protein